MRKLTTLFFLSQVFLVCSQNVMLENALDNEPLTINANSLAQFEAFGLLNSKEAQALALFFKQGAELYSAYQLQGLLGLDSIAVQKLAPFIDSKSIRNPVFHFSDLKLSYQVICQLPTFVKQADDFSMLKDSSFKGANYGIQHRLFLNWDKWQAGIQIAKDTGEPFWHKGSHFGLDFISAHLTYMNASKKAALQKITIGTYQLQWGQGLLLWSTRGLGKSIDLLQLARNAQGLKPYMGKDEQRFLQGISGQFKMWQHQFLFFASIKKIDVKTPTDSLQPEFNFVYANGLHRTTAEISKRKQGLEQLCGIGINKHQDHFQYGALFLYQTAHYLESETTDTLNLAALKSKKLIGLSIFGQGTWRQFYFYGELANSSFFQERPQDAVACNAAFVYHFDQKLELGIHLRYYGLHYQTFYANPISSKTSGSNEQGCIVQLKWRPVKQWELKLSSDWVCFPKIELPEQYPTAYSTVRLYLQYQATKHNFYRCQVNWQPTALTMKTLRCAQQLVYQLDKRNAFDIEFQSQFAISNSSPSRHFAIGWTFKPLAAILRFEIRYGFYEIPLSNPTVFNSVHLMGFGTRAVLLKGVGSYVFGAVEFDIFEKINVSLLLYLNDCISINYYDKLAISIALHKKK